MIYIKELIAAVKEEQAHWDTTGVDWDAECIFSVRIAVHVVTAIIVEWRLRSPEPRTALVPK